MSKTKRGWIVEIEQGLWLAKWQGDPGRTLVKDSARMYDSQFAAQCALQRARKFSPFQNAKICWHEKQEENR